LKNLFAAAFPGLVLDVKGNMIDHCRALARDCGREDDIVELGTGDVRAANQYTGRNGRSRRLRYVPNAGC
jgi:hypothetical protein